MLLFLSLAFCVVSLTAGLLSPKIGRVDTVHNPNFRFDGSSQYKRALLKYKIIPSHPLAQSYGDLLQSREFDFVQDTDLGVSPSTFVPLESFYLNPVSVGEGPEAKSFLLEFDTGSPDLWLFSTLQSNKSRKHHKLYNPAASKSSVPLNKSWNISYIDGTGASGVAFLDTITIGGIEIKGQAVEAAINVTKDFTESIGDGLLGLDLGPNTIAPGIVATTVQNFIQNSQFEQPVFTALLTRASEPPGFFTFGHIDDTLSSPGIEFVNLSAIVVQSRGAWGFPSEYVVIDGKETSREENIAIADTGTSGILLEISIVKDLYRQLNGHFDKAQQGFVFPANTTKFPTLTLPAGGNNITLQPDDFSLGPIGHNLLFGSIQDRGNLNYDIFGTSWLNNIYAIFDLGLTGKGVTRFGLVSRDTINK